jgi:hypothetical protein
VVLEWRRRVDTVAAEAGTGLLQFLNWKQYVSRVACLGSFGLGFSERACARCREMMLPRRKSMKGARKNMSLGGRDVHAVLARDQAHVEKESWRRNMEEQLYGK